MEFEEVSQLILCCRKQFWFYQCNINLCMYYYVNVLGEGLCSHFLYSSKKSRNKSWKYIVTSHLLSPLFCLFQVWDAAHSLFSAL